MGRRAPPGVCIYRMYGAYFCTKTSDATQHEDSHAAAPIVRREPQPRFRLPGPPSDLIDANWFINTRACTCPVSLPTANRIRRASFGARRRIWRTRPTGGISNDFFIARHDDRNPDQQYHQHQQLAEQLPHFFKISHYFSLFVNREPSVQTRTLPRAQQRVAPPTSTFRFRVVKALR